MRPPFIITRRDFGILTRLLRLSGAIPPRVAALIRDRTVGAEVISGHLVPASLALLESRIRYRVGSAQAETRTLSSDLSTAGLGMFLPISSVVAVALLGLREGQTFRYKDAQGTEQTVILEKVLYQRPTSKRAVVGTAQ